MLLTRKVKSAVQLLRRKGVSAAAEVTRIRAAEFCRANRPLPVDAERRACLLAATLNRWSGFSNVVVGTADLGGVRDAVLLPYLRHRFAEAATAASRLDGLRPIEVAIAADGLWSTWDFHGIAEASPDWVRITAGTPLGLRVVQTVRRAALRMGRLGEAARGLDAAGGDLGSLVLLGDVRDAMGRMDDAGAAYEAAVRLDGSDPIARLHYGFHLMKAGHVRDGLANWSASDTLAGNYPLRRHRPHWTGAPLDGRRLMVLFEHGLGDMLQMARFLPRLRHREPTARLMGRVPAPIVGLMRRAFPFVDFVTEDEREPDYDVFVPAMQLAAVLDAPDLEPCGRYIDLGGPATRPKGGRPRVGVCWRGHPRQYEFTRSIPLAVFARLFARREIDFTVLLNRITPAEALLLAAEPNVAVPPIRDFVDLAGLVASCDLVISVDTAVVHLAGAGGAPTLLLSRPDACWRWGASGAVGPWYDSVEVLRHGGDMDWPAMLAEADERIASLCFAPAVVGA